jgi:hypothetical protein
MAESTETSPPAGPGSSPAGDGRPRPARPVIPLLVTLAAVAGGTVLLGVAAGFIWAAVAPRAVIVVVGRGAADIVNPETTAYIAADGWFALLSVAGGILSGALGYVFAVRRYGAAAMAVILAGAVAAALIAKWIGEQSGQAAVSHSLAVGQAGTLLRHPLAVGGIGVLAFWPLAAALVAGGGEAVAQFRDRYANQPARAARPADPAAGAARLADSVHPADPAAGAALPADSAQPAETPPAP